MKYLSDYTNEPMDKAFDESGAFFAFSNEQLKEGMKDGVEYVNLGAGLICPKDKAKWLVDEIDRIQKRGIDQDLTENGKDKVIERELWNHECFYVGDISDCVDKLVDYKITEEEIRKVYNRLLPDVDL